MIRSFLFLPFSIARRNFLLVARYSLKFTRCSLLIVKSLVTRCKIRSLIVAEVARCKKSLVTCCKILSLLVAKVVCCKIHLLLVAEVAHCKETTSYSLQNSLVTRCRSCSLQKITRYSLQNSLVTRCNKSLVTQCKKIHHSLKQSQVHKVR